MQLNAYCLEMKAYNVKLRFYKFLFETRGILLFFFFLISCVPRVWETHVTLQKLTRIVEEVIVTGLLLKYVYI